MEVDGDTEALARVASDGVVEEGSWPALRTDILARLDKIAHNDFPIPNLPPPAPQPRLLSPLPSSPLEHSSQEANKENTPVGRLPAEPPPTLAPGEMPKQIADMLAGIETHLSIFTTHAPHTIQRLAELALHPRAHYKALASYLHAVDRIVQVTSGTNAYPLPLAIPDMSALNVNGEEAKDPAATVAWSNPTTAPLGSDEALGGALLTPIPWLTRRSPESNGEPAPGAQIHSEGTETIDGPNGMGSIETVSVSVNGVPSIGHARGVTQGELLRQEQRAGVVPINQLSRNQEALSEEGERRVDEEDEAPHARGPEEIGVNDTGPQSARTTSYVGGDGVDMQAIDLEAAVGRKHDEEAPPLQDTEATAEDPRRSPGAESMTSTGTKREAEQDLESETPKKVKESSDEEVVDAETAQDDAEAEAPREEEKKPEDADQVDEP
ncbi:Uncharacterized protein TCAP_00915 [Tolypocladium capitatum]|uniref:Protein phosphatase 4 core regulatory subunit R2 n=1 Tax=Tolypocladium capitatum TaxID=45235 RepID=A0A2K3QNS2_9HYPO|nr:Uncharacterized protein TCAP_00915 [Tolypocladium capitatum]